MTNVASPPTICALLAGPVQIWVDSGTSNALEFLGWSDNGIRIEETMFNGEIKDDTLGGDQGPWTDQQNFGGMHRISMELPRFQDSVLAKLELRYNAAASGPGVGMLLGCSGGRFRVLLIGPNFTRNYEVATGAGNGNCYLLDPIERSPIGSQAARARLTFTAYHAAGVLPWDVDTTGYDSSTLPAICAVYAGPLEIWVDSGSTYAMEFLGYTENGAQIEQSVAMAPIYDDTQGGTQGPPTDFQYFGGEHRIMLELRKYQDSVLAKVEKRYNVAATPAVGMLLGCGGGLFRVLLRGTNFIRNYEAAASSGNGNCAVLDPIERSPIGSQASRARVTFTARHAAAVVPWDSRITTP